MNRKSLRIIGVMFGILILLILSACGGGGSKSKEGDLVISELGLEDLDRPVIAFGLPEPLQPGDVIGAYQMEEYEPVPKQITIETETWFFWIDDYPSAEYVHPTRFVYVDVESGEITVKDEMWWPVLNGTSLWVDESDYWNQDNWIYTNGDFKPQEAQSGLGGKVLMNQIFVPPQQENSPGRAIVMNGWEPGHSLGENFAINSKIVYEELNNSNFETTYFGAKNPDIPESGTGGGNDYGLIQAWFLTAADELKPGDTLIVYLTSHGWARNGTVGHTNVMGEVSLAFLLSKIDPGVHVIVEIQACHSGAFIDGIQDYSDLTLTSADAGSSSHADVDSGWLIFGITEPNPDDEGSEFTNGWVTGFNEIQKDPVQKAEAERRAKANGTNYWVELSALAYLRSMENNAAFLSGFEWPLAVRGTPASRPVVLLDELNDGQSCTTGESLQGETPTGVDIGSAHVMQDPENNKLEVDLELPGLGETIGNLFMGVELRDETGDVPPPNSSWIYDGLGNLNFNIQLSPQGFHAGVHEYDSESGWSDMGETDFTAEVVEDHVLFSIPLEYVPAYSSFYIYSSDYKSCDSVGLTLDGNLIGLIPGEIPDDTVSAPPTLPGSDDNGSPPSTADTSSMGTPQPPVFEDDLLVAEDSLNDVIELEGYSIVDDPVVDITKVLVEYQHMNTSSPLGIQILFAEPLLDNQDVARFSIDIYLDYDGINQRRYEYDLRDGEESLELIEGETNLVIPSLAQFSFGNRDANGVMRGEFELVIPESEIPNIGELYFLSQIWADTDSVSHRDELLVFLTPTIMKGE